MGRSETESGEVEVRGGDSSAPKAPRRRKPPRGCVSSLLALAATTLAIIYRGSLLGAHALSATTHYLLVALALGWLIRSGTHIWIGYLRRVEKEEVSPWLLPLLTVTDIIFGLAWLGGAILMTVGDADTMVTAVATGIACAVSFLLALFTHLAAKAADRPRASERIHDRLHDPLEPGKSTWLGWLLVKLIEARSPRHLLSTYVGGSLAVLLVALVLTASAAVSEDKRDEAEAQETFVGKTAGGKTIGEKDGSGDKATMVPPSTSDVPMVGPNSTAVDLFCFSLKLTMRPASPHPPVEKVTYICSVVSKDQLSSELLVLVPSPRTKARVAGLDSNLSP